MWGRFSRVAGASNPSRIKFRSKNMMWVFLCFEGMKLEIIKKSCQWNPDRKAPVTSRLDPACWSASFTLCLIRIVTFFNVAPSESRGPLTQNKLNYSYVMLVADWLYSWRWVFEPIKRCLSDLKGVWFSSTSLWYAKNIITEHAVERKWHM